MSDIDVYSSPGATLKEADEVPKIGGWLRFYYIMNYVGLIFGTLLFLGVGAGYIFIGQVFDKVLDGPALVVEMIPATVCCYFIIRILPVRNPETPNRLKDVIGYYVVASLIVGAGLYVAHKNGYISDKPAPFLGDLLYYFVWATYFKKSERVANFYGKNAH